MVSWGEFASVEPDLAGRVRDLLEARRHMTLATLRRDGSPRISGTEARITDGEVVLGMMPGSRKALDLRADPRMALHGPTVDPSDDDPAAWPGEAKLAGRAVEILEPPPADGSVGFRVDLTEVVLTRVGSPADHLVIVSWHPDRGTRTRTRR